MTVGPSPSVRRLVISALVLWALATAAYGTLRGVYGERPAFIHVRWAPSVDDAQRATRESRYGLTRGEREEGTTWGYYLTDLSRANVRALVLDPSVEDTHQIHRSQFRVGYRAPRGPYPAAGQRTPDVLEILVWVLVLAGGVSAALAGLPTRIRHRLRYVAFAVTPSSAPLARIVIGTGRWVADRIPPQSSVAVAVFRVLFGIGLVVITASQPVGAGWIANDERAQAAAANPLHAWAVLGFAAFPAMVDWLGVWIGVCGTLFIAGVMAQVSYALLAAGVLAWAFVYTTRIGAHPISALMIAVICLLWSRWGDAWSVDAWLRRRRGREPLRATGVEYGYTLWVPGLVMGVCFAAAALAKLREGPEWILNGTVRYHFLTDSADALVDWGLRLGRQPSLAILVSLAAVAVEALVIAGALSRRWPRRAAAGVGALAILAGFALFQGLIWPGWWLLLLSFLPWHLLSDRDTPASPARSRLRPVQIAVAVLVVVEQVVVSAMKLEVRPLLSTYDMYSTTYESPQHYEEQAGISYWVIGRFAGGATVECAVSAEDAASIARLAPGEDARGPAASALARCERRHAADGLLTSVTVEGRAVAVDWERWRLAGHKTTLVAGPIAVARPRTP